MTCQNPYANLRSLLDTTRRLSREEMAELQLEQGYVARALQIYAQLADENPQNSTYARKRAWLSRLAKTRARLERPRAPGPSSCEPTLAGTGAPLAPTRPEEPSTVRRLPIVAVR